MRAMSVSVAITMATTVTVLLRYENHCCPSDRHAEKSSNAPGAGSVSLHVPHKSSPVALEFARRGGVYFHLRSSSSGFWYKSRIGCIPPYSWSVDVS
jgi:hypothetical protein